MKKLFMRLIRAEGVVLLTVAMVSILWVYRDLTKEHHMRMTFLANPSLQF
jgi:hypothetical protein